MASEYVVVVLSKEVVASHLHSEESLLVRVDLPATAVFVESSDGNDGDDTEGSASIGDAVVALLGDWLLKGLGKDDGVWEDHVDFLGFVHLLGLITDLIDNG